MPTIKIKVYISSSFIACSVSYASLNDLVINDQTLIYAPRVTTQALYGKDDQQGLYADILAPFRKTNNSATFVGAKLISGANNTRLISTGLGNRFSFNTPYGDAVLGAFSYLDYYKTIFGNNHFQLNPGIDLAFETVEMRLQSYLPLGTRHDTVNYNMASQLPNNILNQLNVSNSLSGVTGHSVFDTPVRQSQVVGSGAELEVGKFINLYKGAWLRAGGYHFSFKNQPKINGLQANAELAINPYISLVVQNSYDNQSHYKVSLGTRINFSGFYNPKQISSRLTAPVLRHQARQPYGGISPTRTEYKINGSTFVAIDNAWFFSPTGSPPPGLATTINDCTAANPCSTIDDNTALTISTLAPNANLLFATGNYNIPASTLNANNWVNLRNGQSVQGRNTGWVTSATGSDRPLINGGLFWGDASINLIANGSINSTQVNNNGQIVPAVSSGAPSTVGSAVISVGATGNMLVQDSIIQGSASANNTASVSVFSRAKSTVTNSTLINTTNGNATIANGVASAHGIYSENGADTSNTSIMVTSNGASTGVGGVASFARATAILLSGGTNNSTFANNTVTAMTNGNAASTGQTGALGIALNGYNGILSISDNTIGASTTGSANLASASVSAFGISFTGGSGLMSLVSSNVTASTSGASSNSTFARASGISGGGTLDVTNSVFNISTTGTSSNSQAQAFGITSATSVSVANSILIVSTSGAASNSANKSAVGTNAGTTITVADSVLNVSTSGTVTSSAVANALGMLHSNSATSLRNTITSNTSGDSSAAGRTIAVGIDGGGNHVVTDNVINVSTSGNSTGANSRSFAEGVFSSIFTGSGNTINVSTSGTQSAGGNVNVFGVEATGAINFVNNQSTITANSTGNAALEAPVTGVVNNNSTPPSQCSTDGITYTNC